MFPSLPNWNRPAAGGLFNRILQSDSLPLLSSGYYSLEREKEREKERAGGPSILVIGSCDVTAPPLSPTPPPGSVDGVDLLKSLGQVWLWPLSQTHVHQERCAQVTWPSLRARWSEPPPRGGAVVTSPFPGIIPVTWRQCPVVVTVTNILNLHRDTFGVG